MSNEKSEHLVGAVEAGGTKVRAATVTSGLQVVDQVRIETSDSPDRVLEQVYEFYASRSVASIGLAAFGPIDLRAGSRTFGHLLRTPKPGWSGFDLVGGLRDWLSVPVVVDTDVGAAALAEAMIGAAANCRVATYVTVGTGIGGATVVDRRIHHGHGHSEFGHIRVAPAESDDFRGSCPFHGACLEGLASGAALAARRAAGDAEPLRHTAGYLAQLVAALTYLVAPEVVVLGGGVLSAPRLLRDIRLDVQEALAGYSTNTDSIEPIERYLQPPMLGADAGIIGAAILGLRA